MTNSNDKYIPGTCNIGRPEINGRKISLLIVLVISFGYVCTLQVLKVNHVWRLLFFVPASLVAIYFFQVFMRFCIALGIRGVFNFGNKGKTTAVESEENRRKDKSKALGMLFGGIAIGAVVTVIYYLLPV